VSPRVHGPNPQLPADPGILRSRHRPAAEPNPTGRRLASLSLAALGVVYGDIGTSPLYAFRACFDAEYGLAPTASTVYGVLSLIAWSLILVVSVKYIVVVMRLDNRGEGGIVALLALLRQKRRWGPLIGLGLFGAALLYGDGVITPAISVLSAAEGLEVATPAFRLYVLPSTLFILFVLFFVQKYGTARVGCVFGPVMLLWCGTIATLGTLQIAREPAVLLALNPWYGVRFLLGHGVASFLVLGAVVLAVTGAEALYADMGHFGRTPIRLVWFAVVLPALLLNYFGQGALVLRVPEAVQNPFYLLAPRAFLYPLVAIATLATVVASQALISGAFSLTQQCVQLHYSPRVSIVHTSRSRAGQIYIPAINTALMVGCLLLVLAFRSSAALGAAYGVAVTGTMAVTTVLFYVIARQRWHWPALGAGALAGAFLVIDLAFFGANIVKVAHGGWVPLAIGGGVFLLMSTWHRGTELFRGFLAQSAVPMDRFIRTVEGMTPPRVSGTAVFLTPDVDGAPLVLQRHLAYNKVLHEEVILLSILTEELPEVEHDRRVTTESLPQGFHRVRAYYGFMERPDVQEILAMCRRLGLKAEAAETIYYLGRAEILSTGPAPMMRWRKRLFSFMTRNAGAATDFFNIPPDRVVELGARIEL
jgi:KUP system potassium uptake protein